METIIARIVPIHSGSLLLVFIRRWVIETVNSILHFSAKREQRQNKKNVLRQ